MAVATPGVPQAPRPPARLFAAGGAVFAILIVATGVLYWRHAQTPPAGLTCAGAATEVATLFSDGQTTAIRLSNPDFGNMRILGTAPAAVLPGLFQSLLSLSNDNTRLAYVTADDETMANANIWSISTASPGQSQLLAQIPTGFWVVKPVWSPDNRQLAYLALDPTLAAQHQTELVLWVVQAGSPPRKVGSFPQLKPEDFFGDHPVPLCWATDNRTLIFDLAGPGVTTVAPATTTSAVRQTTTTSTTASAASTASGEATNTSSAATAAPSLRIVVAAPAGPARQLQIDTATGASTVVLRPPQPQPPLLGGSAPPQPTGSACGVPVFSQNDPTWRFIVMESGGDEIGPYGCALTSTAMVLNHYGASLSPPQLNACLKGGADPIYWSEVPGCANGLVSGGTRIDFSWPALDKVLGAGEPAIIGMLRGQTGMHFIVVTSGGGGNAANYAVTDPWDATTNKSLQTFVNSGYNLAWIVEYSGASANCGRLVPPPPAQAALTIQGVADGGVYNAPVHLSIGGGAKLTISANVINLSIQAAAPQLNIANATTVTATTAAAASSAATGSVTSARSGTGGTASTATNGAASTASTSAATSSSNHATVVSTSSAVTTTVAKSTSSIAQSKPASSNGAASTTSAKGSQAVTSVPVGSNATIAQEGVYQLITAGKGAGLGSATKSVKFTIDRTPPTVQVVWQGAPKQAYGPAKLLSPLPTEALSQSDVPQLTAPAQFQVSAVDTLSGVKSVEFQVDGGDWQPYANDVSFHSLVQISAPGAHTLGVRATDLAGNTSDSQTFTFDVLPPAGAIATATATAIPTATDTPEAATATAGPTATTSPTAAASPSVTGTPAPALALKPTALDFGSVTLGQTGTPQTLTITASGAVPLALGQIQLGGDAPGDFAITQDACSKTTLQPNTSCTVQLTFTPTHSGARKAALTIPSNAGANPASVPMQGTATVTAVAAAVTSSASLTPSPVAGTPIATTTAAATGTPLPLASATGTATGAATPTPTRTPTPGPTATVTPVPPTAAPAPMATSTSAPTATPTQTATPTATPTVAPTATATPCPAFGNAAISASLDIPNGLVRVNWTSSGGCAPYTGTITAQYAPRTTATLTANAASGSLNNPLAQYCASGGPIVYTLNLQDSKGQTAVAETSVTCPATATPTPTPTPISTPTPTPAPPVVTISNVTVNGSPHRVTVPPGASLAVNLSYHIYDAICPNCVDQIELGFITSPPSQCVYSGIPGAAGVSGSASANFTAPTTVGTYYLGWDRAQAFTCAQALNKGAWWNGPPDSSRIFATIYVSASIGLILHVTL